MSNCLSPANLGRNVRSTQCPDSDDHDIDYFYASRLPGEPEEGIEDLHYHPVEPEMFALPFQ